MAARPCDRRRSRGARHFGRLRAGARPGAPRSDPGDRGPGARGRSRARRAPRTGDARRLPCRRHPAGDQASAGPRPGAARQPRRPAGRRRHGCGHGGRGLAAVSRVPLGPARDHRARPLSGAGRGLPGDYVAYDHRRGDPRRDRVSRPAVERRPEHGGALRLARAARRHGARRRLRHRAPLQRRSRRDDRGPGGSRSPRGRERGPRRRRARLRARPTISMPPPAGRAFRACSPRSRRRPGRASEPWTLRPSLRRSRSGSCR